MGLDVFPNFGTLPAPVLFTISALKVCSDLSYSKSSQLGLKTLTCLNNLRDAPAAMAADIFGGWHWFNEFLGCKMLQEHCKSFQIFDEQLGTKLFGCQIRKTYVLGDGGNPVCTGDFWFAGIEEKGTKCISSERRRIMPTLGFCGRNYEGSRVSFVPPYRRLMHQKIDATLGLSLFFWGSLFVEPKEVTILDHTNPWLPVPADDPQHSSEAIGTCFA